MFLNIHDLIREADSFTPASEDQLEEYRLKFLGKKGVLSDLFLQLKQASPEEKKELGLLVNDLKKKAEEKISIYKDSFRKKTKKQEISDPTLPGYPMETGTYHPITLVRNSIIRIFSRIGFSVSDGPEIEDDWHNFSALNFPPEHPARDMQDTFFIDLNPDPVKYNGPLALRTHTSSVQVRVMETNSPPIRTICPGRVYRNEAISARSHCFFHQVEGFYIDEKVSFADLRQTLLYFAKEMFGGQTEIRLRPSYFPFTEPSAEMDISCSICSGNGCNVCKYTGWLEILGCGMIDPDVLQASGIDPERYSGFAFGMGIERIAMMKYNVKDLRIFSENDIRFLRQFKGM